MKETFKRIVAFFTMVITIFPSVFGLPSAYSKYEDSEKYAPALGQIIVDNDMSVPRISLTQDGTSEYVIIRGENAYPSEITAAETLQGYFEQMSGVKIEIFTDSKTEQAKEIIIGKTNRETSSTFLIDREKLGNEGFKSFVYRDKLIIAGGEERGTLYGIYTFLEETLGCRWFTKDLTVIPENKNISIRRDLNIEQTPYFEFRDFSWSPGFDKAYSIAQKINTNLNRPLNAEDGGGIKAIGLGHSFEYQIPSSVYFQDHPEYYALNENGERQSTQPCLTNPDVLQIITEKVLKDLRANPSADFISVSQNDNDQYCLCDNCKAVDEAEGSPVGSLIHLVNAVADEVKKEFPNTYIQTLIYDHTRRAPKVTKPRDNVILHLCSDTSCFSHPLEEGCLVNAFDRTFAEDLASWQNMPGKIYVYDYTTNFSHFPTIHPNFGVLQENMQFFAENNVSGVWCEGYNRDRNGIANNGEFSHLKTYLLSKLMWDPYTDFEKHLNEFMLAYYGEGYQYINRFIDFSTSRGELSHLEMWSSPAKALHLTSADLRKIDKWFDEAEKLAANNFELDNIQASRMQLRYYKNFTQKAEFSKLRNSEKAGEALYDDFMRFGITEIGTGGHKRFKPREEIDFKKPVRQWCIDK